MSNMKVVVEFNAGTSIFDAVIEAKEKASLWKVGCVVFQFNGVEVCVSPRTNTLNIDEEWDKNKETILFL